jgi:hypothetical protein
MEVVKNRCDARRSIALYAIAATIDSGVMARPTGLGTGCDEHRESQRFPETCREQATRIARWRARQGSNL